MKLIGANDSIFECAFLYASIEKVSTFKKTNMDPSVFSFNTLQECRLARNNNMGNSNNMGNNNNNKASLGQGVNCDTLMRRAEQIKECASNGGDREICDAALRRRGDVKHAPMR